MPTPKNEAAWMAARHKPLKVGPAPYTRPGAGEVVVRNHAVAINPVDWMLPYAGGMVFSWIKSPFILGSDLAGEVVEVGAGVTSLKIGDRVLAMAAGCVKQRNRASEGAFQAYSVVLERLTTVIPDQVSYAEAAVVPLGLTTAATGLFQSDLLALDLPGGETKSRDQWVIIWGGATSVGCNAIQLAAAAGYRVVTTASPKNFDYVKSLGATHVYDYNSPTAVADIIAVLAGAEVAGAFAIGAGSVVQLLAILAQCKGRKFIANCSADVSFDAIPPGPRLTVPVMIRLLRARMRGNAQVRRMSRRYGITARFFDASSIVDNPVGPAIYRDFLGSALAAGRFRPAPPPMVVGQGLAAVQAAFDVQRRGVSAAKVVVELD